MTVNVSETFESIQGESSYAGLPCFFIRLSGCNLRCSYCDTTTAYETGREMTIAALVQACLDSRASLVEVTGGEPLLQDSFADLARSLCDQTRQTILVETNGSQNISLIPDRMVAIVDIKCPGSGEHAAMDIDNISRLRKTDEIKFVLSDREDYDWAVRFVKDHDLTSRCAAVWFSPAFERLEPRTLADWLLADALPVRMQLQLHKLAGVK